MYSFKPITDSDFPAIKKLYLDCFKIKVQIQQLMQKYGTSLFGKKTIGFIARDKTNQPVAYYGVFPLRLNYEHKDYLVAQSGDTMTSPIHQKKGLFTTLAKKTYGKAKNEGVEFVFGFPNQNSLPGFQKKLDWIFVGNMLRFNIKNKTLPLLEASNSISLLTFLYKKYAQSILKPYKISLHSLNFKKLIFNENCIKRDERFFKYKLQNKENYLISINGFTMIIKLKGHLVIGEVMFFKITQFPIFLKTIKKLGRLPCCRKTQFTISQNHWLYKHLNTKLTPDKHLPIGFRTLSNNVFDFKKITLSHIDFDTF